MFICTLIHKGTVKRTFLIDAKTVTEADNKIRIANMKQIQAKDEAIIKHGFELVIGTVDFENGLMEI